MALDVKDVAGSLTGELIEKLVPVPAELREKAVYLQAALLVAHETGHSTKIRPADDVLLDLGDDADRLPNAIKRVGLMVMPREVPPLGMILKDKNAGLTETRGEPALPKETVDAVLTVQACARVALMVLGYQPNIQKPRLFGDEPPMLRAAQGVLIKFMDGDFNNATLEEGALPLEIINTSFNGAMRYLTQNHGTPSFSLSGAAATPKKRTPKR